MDQRGLIVTRSARLRVSLVRKTKWPMSAVIHNVNVPVTRASAAPLTAACTSVGLHFSWAASAQKITSAQSHERITRPTDDTSPFCPLISSPLLLVTQRRLSDFGPITASAFLPEQHSPLPSNLRFTHLFSFSLRLSSNRPPSFYFLHILRLGFSGCRIDRSININNVKLE